LSFLKEQSEIAKKLGIAKNTIEVQTFGNENGMLTSVNNADSPFYLRGYEAIDKQIELINLRTDKTFFIDGLFELEQNLRSIKQNKIVERIQDDKSVERIKLSYKSTPLDVENQFYAASANVFATSYSYYNEKIIIAISIILGLVIGIFYVVISNSFQSNRVLNKK
jgi:LPS O-antigen subunit length determinant protein (WzzB/FepE family)